MSRERHNGRKFKHRCTLLARLLLEETLYEAPEPKPAESGNISI
jgi:hypothetical protein